MQEKVEAQSILSMNSVEVLYDNVMLAIKGVSVQVPKGKMIALLGSNGAGKSTTLKAISGLLKAERGRISRGEIKFNGTETKVGIKPVDFTSVSIVPAMMGANYSVSIVPAMLGANYSISYIDKLLLTSG